MRPPPTIALVICSMIAACATAPHNAALDKYPSGVLGRTTIDYYDVHGSTFAEVRADMRKQGPRIADTGFVGETRSPMRWSYRLARTGTGASSCEIADVQIQVNAQVYLPRWTAPADAEPGLAVEWARFVDALETHESGHKDITAHAAKEIIDRLRGMNGLCATIGDRANAIAHTIADRAQGEQRQYDADTRHGVLQGTSFGARGARMAVATDSLTLIVPPRPGTVLAPVPGATLEKAWAALPASYMSMGLRVNATDTVAHAAGDAFVARSSLDKRPLSDFLVCGSASTPVNVNDVDVAMFVTSRLQEVQASPMSEPALTVVNTVQAVVHPRSGPLVLCRSRGVIERELLQALRLELTH